MRMRLAAEWSSLLVLVGAVASPPFLQAQDTVVNVRAPMVSSAARGIILRDISAWVAWHPNLEDFDTSRVMVRVTNSSTVPTLRYYWSFYHPPLTSHVEHSLQIGELDGSIGVLHTASDWRHLVQRTGWRAQTPAEALAICQELVARFGVRTRRYNPSVLWVDQVVREGLDPFAQAYVDSVRPPAAQVQGTSGHWVVEAWALEPGALNQYRCAPNTWRPLRLLKSIPGGLLDVGRADSPEAPATAQRLEAPNTALQLTAELLCAAAAPPHYLIRRS